MHMVALKMFCSKSALHLSKVTHSWTQSWALPDPLGQSLVCTTSKRITSFSPILFLSLSSLSSSDFNTSSANVFTCSSTINSVETSGTPLPVSSSAPAASVPQLPLNKHVFAWYLTYSCTHLWDQLATWIYNRRGAFLLLVPKISWAVAQSSFFAYVVMFYTKYHICSATGFPSESITTDAPSVPTQSLFCPKAIKSVNADAYLALWQ